MIATGTFLLNYRIVEKIGEGGMGAVWKATDSTLDRDVAIKVLPADFASDAERLARFEREAKVLASLGSGLMRIPAGGGMPESLTKPDGAAKGYAHVFPQALPGRRTVLFTSWGQSQGSAAFSLDTGQWELVLPAATFGTAIFDATGGSPGRLLLIDQGAGIRAAPFDPAHPKPTSADKSVLDNVYYDVETETQGWLAISNTGTAVYAPGNPAKASLVWVDRDGKLEAFGKEQDAYREVSISPDGTKAVVRHRLDLWIHDLERGTRSPLTSGNASNNRPLWSRDGLRIIFASNRGGAAQTALRPVSVFDLAGRDPALHRDPAQDRARSVDLVAGW